MIYVGFILMILSSADRERLVTDPIACAEPFVAEAVYGRGRIVSAFGGLQSGKTLSAADALYLMLYGDHPVTLPPQLVDRTPMEVWVLSKSYALVDTAIMTFRMRADTDIWLSESECRALGVKRMDPRTWWLRPRKVGIDSQPICLRGRTASDPEALRATPSLGIAWCDEIAHWKELAWHNLLGRGIVARTRFLISTTPKGKNWLYREVYLPAQNEHEKDISSYTWKSADNPYADKEYIEKLRKKFGPGYAAQELDALFTQDTGYVYDFDRTIHCKELPSDDPAYYAHRVIGVDPGYGDPYAAGMWLKDYDHHWWLADELYLPQKAVVDDVIPTLAAWAARWKVERIYVDKRRPTDWAMMRRKGLPAVANVDVFGEDDRRTVMPMIRMVQRLFREGRIHLSPHCEWHAEEFENYAFRSNEERNAGENPLDHKNHCMDATRYAIASVDALPEDMRPRYRQGMAGVPMAVGRVRSRPQEWKPPTVKESLSAQEKKWSEAAQGRYSRDRQENSF